MEHQGYRGKATFDDEAGVFHGEVVGIRDVVTFQGETVAELRAAFRDSVDEYLKFCAEKGQEPNRPFSGRVSLRMSPEIHQAASTAAQTEGKSLNAWLTSAIEKAAKEPVWPDWSAI